MRHVALVVLLGACAHTPAPTDPTERALFRDLERDVTVASATGWGVDRIEVQNMLERAMDSVCRVDELGRRGLHEWLDAEIAREGGPVDRAWRARGKKLSRVENLLTLDRVRMLLERAQQASPDCPFWIEPENPFRGRQISEHRWELVLGGGGIASAIAQGQNTDISAGGAGRLVIGRMFANGDGLYAGAEVAGSAQFPKDASGERTSLELGVDLVTPIVYRRTLTNTFFELEGGWVGHATEHDWGDIESGAHLGVAFGGRALRQRFVFPGAALTFAYEQLFLDGNDLITIKVGARVQFDLDL